MYIHVHYMIEHLDIGAFVPSTIACTSTSTFTITTNNTITSTITSIIMAFKTLL